MAGPRPSAELVAFQRRLGHQFADPALLIRALTHSSLSSPTRPDNQRLEFLGDRVLGLTIAEALLRADRGATEGQLAPRLNALVRGETCADIARQIGLGEVLKLGRSEMMTGGRRKDALLGSLAGTALVGRRVDRPPQPRRDLSRARAAATAPRPRRRSRRRRRR